MSAAPKKGRAQADERTNEAIAAIRQLETEQVDWDAAELAKRIGVSVQHARNIIVRLTFRGTLQYAVATVKKRRLVLDAAVPAVAA